MGLESFPFLIRDFNLGLEISKIGNILILELGISGFLIRISDFGLVIYEIGDMSFSILIRNFNLGLGVSEIESVLILGLGIFGTRIKYFKFGARDF